MIEKILEKLEELNIESQSCSECAYIKECDSMQEKYDIPDNVCLCTMLMKLKAKEIVQEVAKEYANMWIQVSERLPEPFQRVLVYDALDDSITIEHLQENDSFIDSVVAWMPLPIAPYQKGE